MKKRAWKISLVIEPDEDEFHAYCPALKGLHTCGDTEDEVLLNAFNACIAYIESMKKHNEKVFSSGMKL